MLCTSSFWISLIGLFLATAIGQVPSPHRVLVFDRTNIVLDEVTQGEVIPISFGFENKGALTIRVVGVAVSCGCTIVRTAPKYVKPAERSAIEITLNTRGLKDTIQRSIEVTYTDEIEGTREILKVSARVFPPRRPLIADPSEIDLGKNYSGTIIQRTVRLVDRSGRKNPLVAIRAKGPEWLQADLGEMSPIDGYQELRLTGRLPVGSGVLREKVSIFTTRDGESPLDLPLYGTVISSLQSDPVALVSVLSDKIEDSRGRLIIRDISGQGFTQIRTTVESVETDSVAVDVSRIPGKESIALTIRPTKQRRGDVLEGAVVVSATLKDRKEAIRLPYLFLPPPPRAK